MIADAHESESRAQAALLSAYIASATFWLIVTTAVGVLLSFKFPFPDLATSPYLSFGRLRPIHTNGTFYGVTNQGGTGGVGTVFSLNMGLGPFVKLVSTSGKVGATVTILGTKPTGVTSVSFNGTSATFKVPTSTYLTATVPEGATSGLVQVVTSIGTLQSNVAFQIVP